MVVKLNTKAKQSPPSVNTGSTTGATTDKLKALSKSELDTMTVNTARGRSNYKRSRLKVARYGL